jgi:peptidoglycan/LPS O-acetylase OafA/YrhL
VYFALGVYAYLVRDRIPIRGWLALLCLAALLLTIRTPAFAAITIPCIAYLTLFAAMRLPIRNFDRRADLSYGLYIYAFAIAQLLAMYGLGSLGFTAYFIATLALALIFAAGSWYVIEKPCLQLKSAALPLHKRRTGGKPSMGEAV